MSERNVTAVADICLILEGTYPYVSGGVSTWVHQILNMFPEWNFSILFLGAQHDPQAKYKYELPSNVVKLEEVYLFDNTADNTNGKESPQDWAGFYEAARRLAVRTEATDASDFQIIRQLMQHVRDHPNISFEQFWKARHTWNLIGELYERSASTESFLDFFWALRFLVQPLWKLARGLARVPSARLYHTACTGYAGLAAALISSAEERPMILTEHGIYLRERIVDICRSVWIPQQLIRHPNPDDPLGYLREMWIGFFDTAARTAYHHSDSIVSLFGKNARAQEYFGAAAEKISIIPNGIPTEKFEPLIEQRAARRTANPHGKTIGFLGRVVSIKDVKTLIRTARRVADSLPDVTFLIAGPTEEEPDYYEECRQLVEQLQVGKQIQFLGPQKIHDFLPKLDIMILTSISEGLPFVVIESLAAGIPVVSTDVGACSELILGRSDEDCERAGLIAEIGNSEELAQHCMSLLTQPAELERMSVVGLKRVHQLYHEREIKLAYQKLYQHNLNSTY